MPTFDDFKQLDIRVARVLTVENHPNADKLYVMKIDMGDSQRQIVAGLKKHYKPEELHGKLIVVVTNLPPVELRGVKSEGMLLAAVQADKVVVLLPEKEIAVGAKVS